MEIGQAVFALDFVDPKLDFPKCVILIFLQISERDFKDPSFESVVCVLEPGCSVHQGLANTGLGKSYRSRLMM